MKIVWRGKHPEGGTITSLQLSDHEIENLVDLPPNWEELMLNLENHKAVAKQLGVRTKWFCINAS